MLQQTCQAGQELQLAQCAEDSSVSQNPVKRVTFLTKDETKFSHPLPRFQLGTKVGR